MSLPDWRELAAIHNKSANFRTEIVVMDISVNKNSGTLKLKGMRQVLKIYAVELKRANPCLY